MYNPTLDAYYNGPGSGSMYPRSQWPVFLSFMSFVISLGDLVSDWVNRMTTEHFQTDTQFYRDWEQAQLGLLVCATVVVFLELVVFILIPIVTKMQKERKKMEGKHSDKESDKVSDRVDLARTVLVTAKALCTTLTLLLEDVPLLIVVVLSQVSGYCSIVRQCQTSTGKGALGMTGVAMAYHTIYTGFLLKPTESSRAVGTEEGRGGHQDENRERAQIQRDVTDNVGEERKERKRIWIILGWIVLGFRVLTLPPLLFCLYQVFCTRGQELHPRFDGMMFFKQEVEGPVYFWERPSNSPQRCIKFENSVLLGPARELELNGSRGISRRLPCAAASPYILDLPMVPKDHLSLVQDRSYICTATMRAVYDADNLLLRYSVGYEVRSPSEPLRCESGTLNTGPTAGSDSRRIWTPQVLYNIHKSHCRTTRRENCQTSGLSLESTPETPPYFSCRPPVNNGKPCEIETRITNRVLQSEPFKVGNCVIDVLKARLPCLAEVYLDNDLDLQACSSTQPIPDQNPTGELLDNYRLCNQ